MNGIIIYFIDKIRAFWEDIVQVIAVGTDLVIVEVGTDLAIVEVGTDLVIVEEDTDLVIVVAEGTDLVIAAEEGTGLAIVVEVGTILVIAAEAGTVQAKSDTVEVVVGINLELANLWVVARRVVKLEVIAVVDSLAIVEDNPTEPTAVDNLTSVVEGEHRNLGAVGSPK